MTAYGDGSTGVYRFWEKGLLAYGPGARRVDDVPGGVHQVAGGVHRQGHAVHHKGLACQAVQIRGGGGHHLAGGVVIIVAVRSLVDGGGPGGQGGAGGKHLSFVRLVRVVEDELMQGQGIGGQVGEEYKGAFVAAVFIEVVHRQPVAEQALGVHGKGGGGAFQDPGVGHVGLHQGQDLLQEGILLGEAGVFELGKHRVEHLELAVGPGKIAVDLPHPGIAQGLLAGELHVPRLGEDEPIPQVRDPPLLVQAGNAVVGRADLLGAHADRNAPQGVDHVLEHVEVHQHIVLQIHVEGLVDGGKQ